MQFTPLTQARTWNGRYARIPGREPAFHVSVTGVITAVWTDHANDERLTAPLEGSPGAKALAKSLNDTKEQHTGHRGGSFLINEFGQVICPVAGSSTRYLVGNVSGTPRFHDPLNGGMLTLNPPKSFQPGTIWAGPYIGMKFNLAHNDQIYFKHEEQDTTTRIWLNQPNSGLIKLLRRVRPAGAVRFIVNLHGAVFTKVESPPGQWTPVFVGYIEPEFWYPRES